MSKISIITINYNNCKGLKKTLESVFKQTYQEFEYIVIDGNSTDGSRELIEEHASQFTYWVSEPDKGIYNAMNKGWRKADGEYCLFLNSGDFLLNENILAKISNEMQINRYSHPVYYCDLLFIDSMAKKKTERIYPDSMSLSFFAHSSLGHPATLISKALLEQHSGYSENYKILSDWLFFVQVYLAGNHFKHIQTTFAVFDDGGLSSDITLLEKEKENVLKNELFFLQQDFNSFVTLVHFNNSRSHTLLNRLLTFLNFRKRKN